MADGQPMFEVNGKKYSMPSNLSLGEMCDAEKEFGVEFGNNASSGMRMAAALLWIAIRRDDPTVTAADIRDLPADVFATLTEEEDVRPLGNGESSSELSAPSGVSSSNGLDDLDGIPEPTGSPL